MMLVILLGHIDLSVPWTLAAAAMMATAVGGPLAIPVGLGVGLLVGLVNGLGVAYLRVPSMIFTLGVNAVMRGLMVVHTGGFAPQTAATELMSYLATGHSLGMPMRPARLGAALGGRGRSCCGARRSAATSTRSATARRAAYLSGINTRARAGRGLRALRRCCAGLAGVLLAGYSTKAYQGMGDAYLLPSIAAVVIGGTNILGGRGRYARHGRRHHPDRAAVVGAVGHADARGRPPDHLRHRHHRDAAGLRARPTRRRLSHRHLAVRLLDVGQRITLGRRSVVRCRPEAPARASWYRGSAQDRTRTASPSRNSGS